MSATAEEVRDILKSIDTGIKTLIAHFGAGARPAAANVSASQGGMIASDRELDSQYGDPEIKMVDPRDWSGDSMKGRHMSECPPEYLDIMADRFDYFTEKAEGDISGEDDPDVVKKLKDKIKYNNKDSARARGWAKRLRGGWTPPVEEPISAPPHDGAAPLTDDDIPFIWMVGAVGLAHAAFSLLA